MIVVNYLAAVALFGIGLYAVLTRRNMIKMVMGLSLMEASTYLFMISLAYRAGSTAPILLSPPPGKSAAWSATAEYPGEGVPALEAAYQTGNIVVQALLKDWSRYRDVVPGH